MYRTVQRVRGASARTVLISPYASGPVRRLPSTRGAPLSPSPMANDSATPVAHPHAGLPCATWMRRMSRSTTNYECSDDRRWFRKPVLCPCYKRHRRELRDFHQRFSIAWRRLRSRCRLQHVLRTPPRSAGDVRLWQGSTGTTGLQPMEPTGCTASANPAGLGHLHRHRCVEPDSRPLRLFAGERVLELALVHVRTSFDVAALRLGVQLFLCVSGRTGV